MKRQYKVGQKLIWKTDDFDGKNKVKVTVTKVERNHVIAKTEDGITAWIDDDTEYQFFTRK
jgi:hypothetical protein